MSYDIWLEARLGGEGTVRIEAPGNITYNVDPMFALALGRNAEDGIQNGYELLIDRKGPALSPLQGKRAGDCVRLLQSAVRDMKAHADEYERLNPENGGGDYEGALGYSESFADACRRYPRAIVEMWL